MAVGAFIWLLVFSKREIAVLKDFIDNVVYGLVTAPGIYYFVYWYICPTHRMDGKFFYQAYRHLGLPENHDFIFCLLQRSQ